MTADPTAAEISDILATPSVLPTGVRARILIYLSVLLVLLGFGSPAGGLIGRPISFLLKNKLHLQAHEMAIFTLKRIAHPEEAAKWPPRRTPSAFPANSAASHTLSWGR